ncbi:hypothetical protein G6L37_00425 [Agrobacterium rubi]|nr:hypothetical protein [Agrobacterium rubi]NTF23854.1 hypothetical protein [Agrobacterium rubi]
MSASENEINDKARAILSEFGFDELDILYAYRDNSGFLYRLTSKLSENISNALPALQPDADKKFGIDRMTFGEREYSKHFFYLDHESLILPLFRDEGWSVRRVHRHLTEMLRALIALDPERLREFEVVVPGEEVARIAQGGVVAGDLAESERHRMKKTTVEGHMLRYGLFLGLSMAMDGRSSDGDLKALARTIADEMGASDPLERPKYKMHEDVIEFIRKARQERDEKERAGQ